MKEKQYYEVVTDKKDSFMAYTFDPSLEDYTVIGRLRPVTGILWDEIGEMIKSSWTIDKVKQKLKKSFSITRKQ